jgi:hypothetical protein
MAKLGRISDGRLGQARVEDKTLELFLGIFGEVDVGLSKTGLVPLQLVT